MKKAFPRAVFTAQLLVVAAITLATQPALAAADLAQTQNPRLCTLVKGKAVEGRTYEQFVLAAYVDRENEYLYSPGPEHGKHEGMQGGGVLEEGMAILGSNYLFRDLFDYGTRELWTGETYPTSKKAGELRFYDIPKLFGSGPGGGRIRTVLMPEKKEAHYDCTPISAPESRENSRDLNR